MQAARSLELIPIPDRQHGNAKSDHADQNGKDHNGSPAEYCGVFLWQFADFLHLTVLHDEILSGVFVVGVVFVSGNALVCIVFQIETEDVYRRRQIFFAAGQIFFHILDHGSHTVVVLIVRIIELSLAACGEVVEQRERGFSGHIQIEEYAVGIHAVEFLIGFIAECNGVRIRIVPDGSAADPESDVHAAFICGFL